MKKSVAVAGASVLGLGMAVAGGASAQAADVTTPCTGIADHTVTNGTLADNWFMDCVPQYGIGKVEFTLTSTVPIPASFLPLTDPGVTSTYSGDAAAALLYTGGPAGVPAGFATFAPGSAPYEYLGQMIVPISGVQSIVPSTLPATCDPTTNSYEHAYRIDYAPTTVTFTQTVDGEAWEFPVSYAATSTYFGLNFGGANASVSDGGLDEAEPQCMVFSNGSAFAADSVTDPTEFQSIVNGVGAGEGETPLVPAALITMDVARYITPPEDPSLADTGVSEGATLTGIAAGVLALISGFVLAIFARRRRREA